MRRTLIACGLLVATAGCGDDGKTAPRGTPSAPPAPTLGPASAGTPAPDPTPDPAPAPFPDPAPRAPDAPSPWATTRVGDWATWDVRVAGTDVVTKLTWRATKVDVAGVRFGVEARTLDVHGVTLSTVTGAEEFHAAGDPPLPYGPSEVIEVAGASIDARRSVRTGAGGDVTVWSAPSVPFSGLVRSKSLAVEQVLVGFGRGP